MARWVSDTDVRIGPSLQSFINVLGNSEPARRPSIKVVVHLWRELVHWYSVLDRIAVENVEQRYVMCRRHYTYRSVDYYNYAEISWTL